MSTDGKTIALMEIFYTQSASSSTQLDCRPIVTIFQLTLPNTWNQIGQIDGIVTVTASSTDDVVCSLALSGDGTRVALGEASAGRLVASGNASSTPGLVRVFNYSGGNWSQIGTTLSSNIAYSMFGTSVDLSQDGSTLAVGSSFGGGTGNVNAYTYNGSAWVAKGQQLDGSTSLRFGSNVKLSANGDSVLVAASVLNGSRNNEVSVFVWNGGTGQWVKRGSSVTNPATGSITLWFSRDGNKFAVGYPSWQGNNGLVNVYEYGTNDWVQKGGSFSGVSGVSFGSSVVLNQEATSIVIGSPTTPRTIGGLSRPNVGGLSSFTFISSTSTWVGTTYTVETGKLDNQYFGMGLACNDNFTVFGVLSKQASDVTLSKVVTVVQSLNLSLTFSPNTNPINVTTNDTVPSNNFIAAAKYGGFSQYDIPSVCIQVNNMPSSFASVGDYTVTYNVTNGASNGQSAFVQTVAAGTVLYSVTRTIRVTQYIAPICFYAGAKVLTDQGEVEIQDIVPHKNSIDGMLVCDVTKVLNSESTMTFIEKDAFGCGVPYCDTYVTNKHKVLYDGRLIPAKELVEIVKDHKKVALVTYSGAPVHNVVLMKPHTMVVNGMTCETLHPRNVVYLRIKIREEMATCKDPRRMAELMEQDNMIVEAVGRHLVKND